MTLDYNTPGVLKTDLTEYVKSMVEDSAESTRQDFNSLDQERIKG